MVEAPGFIPRDQAVSDKGCGAGTERACFALASSFGESELYFQCLIIANPELALIVGERLKMRLNRDPADEKVWCPLGVLPNSKQVHLQESS